MHLSQLFSLCPKLLSKTTSFSVVSASLVHLTCLWGPEGAESLFSTEQTTPNLRLFRDVQRSWSCSAQSKEGPMSACCHFQLNKLTFSPNHVMSEQVQIFLPLLHHQSLVIYINLQILILIDIDFAVFSFTECSLLPCNKTRNRVTSFWITFHSINLCLNLFWTYRTET